MAIILNDLETRRFGVVCARLDMSDRLPDIDSTNRAAKEAGVSMLTARVPAEDLESVRALEADGYRLMDTLVYYGRVLDSLPKALPLAEGVTLRPGMPEDVDAVGSLAQAAFSGYLGHYHADPRLDDSAATEAYVEWAVTSLARVGNKGEFLVATVNGQIAGFLALQSISAEEAEIALNAVDPGFQRRGLYAGLVRAAMTSAAAMKFKRVFTSTQINNYAVQKVWTRLGLIHERSYYTLHKWFD